MIFDRDAQAILDIFSDLNIPFYLGGGTLLCIYRDGTLQNTNDVDLWVLEKDVTTLLSCQEQLAKELGHFRHPENERGTCKYIWEFPLGQLSILVDLGPHYTESSLRLPFTIPKGFFPIDYKLCWKYKWRGKKYPIPWDTEDFLAHYFGPTWRMPIPSIAHIQYQQFARRYPNDPQVYPVNKSNVTTSSWKEKYDTARTLPLYK